MKLKTIRPAYSRKLIRCCVAITCVALLLPAYTVSSSRAAFNPVVQDAIRISTDQLDSLVAPIALYPDNLLSQTLVASTYPLEIIQLQQWLEKNPNLAKDQKKLTEAVKKQPWDPSVQAMAAMPDVVKRLADDIQWTTDLGNAFLAQQSDVMDAVQRMRTKAQGTGALASNQQQKVETQVVESKQVIVIEQANPEVVYVPSYNPTVVYGAPVYPYPPIYYPPSTGAVIAASAISFGVGWAMGAAWGGGWGWGCGWGHGDVDVNINNNFNRNANIQGGNRTNISGNRGGGNTWQHNPQHRGGAPYGDRNTANKFGGTARGDSLANRQRSAQQSIGRQGGNLGSVNRPGGVSERGGVSDRTGAGVADRNRTGAGVSDRSRTGTGVSDRTGAGVSDRSRTGAGVSDRSRTGAGVSDRTGAGVSDRAGGGRGSMGASGDRVGNRSVSSGSTSRGAFGGGSGGFNGASARASSSRGASSMGASRGGFSGGTRSGGGFGGGGGRGGGGRRR